MIKVLQMPIRNAKGGITQYALRNWEHIDKNTFQFDWVTLDKTLSFEDELLEQGCRVHHLSCRQDDDELRFRTEMEEILSNNYDVIHLHTSYWRGFLAEEIAIKAGVPKIIVHAHSTGIDVSDITERNRLFDRHSTWKEKFSANLATHFVTCSSPAADFLFGPQIPKDKIVLLRNAIDTEMYAFNPQKRASVRNRLGFNEEFIILQPARLEYQKNHSFTLKVFKRLIKKIPNARLLLTGEGDLRSALENEAMKQEISERVYFLGFRDDIPDLLQAADLLLMPSLFEGLTIAAVEAQCSGIQCFFSDQLAVETILTGNAQMIPLDECIWIEKIIDFAHNMNERRDQSIEITNAGYSLIDQIRILEQLYSGEDL